MKPTAHPNFEIDSIFEKADSRTQGHIFVWRIIRNKIIGKSKVITKHIFILEHSKDYSRLLLYSRVYLSKWIESTWVQKKLRPFGTNTLQNDIFVASKYSTSVALVAIAKCDHFLIYNISGAEINILKNGIGKSKPLM